jgi:hypothetical protein
VNDWIAAADALERLLERAGRLVDGDAPDAGELQAEPPLYDLAAQPDAPTLARIGDMLAQTEEALTALDWARAEVTRRLDQLDRHRPAAAAYVRTSTTTAT